MNETLLICCLPLSEITIKQKLQVPTKSKWKQPQWYHKTSNESTGANRTPGPSVQVNGHKIVTKAHKVVGPIVSPNQDDYNHFKEILLSCTNQEMDKRRGRERYHCNICSIKKFWLVHLQSTIKQIRPILYSIRVRPSMTNNSHFFPRKECPSTEWMNLTSHRQALYYLEENQKETRTSPYTPRPFSSQPINQPSANPPKLKKPSKLPYFPQGRKSNPNTTPQIQNNLGRRQTFTWARGIWTGGSPWRWCTPRTTPDTCRKAAASSRVAASACTCCISSCDKGTKTLDQNRIEADRVGKP